MTPVIRHFYHPPSGTLTYVVSDPSTKVAAVVDPVLGFSIVSGRTDTTHVDAVGEYLHGNDLTLAFILETHAHADHLSAAQVLKSRFGGTIGIGRKILDVQAHFKPLFNLKAPFAADGHQFDHLFSDGETFMLGELECRIIATPGHTNDGVTYLVGDAAFVGDTLFMTDAGTARCDFPGGDAGLLFDSIMKLLALPEHTMLYLCHDYPPDGRELRFAVSVREQKAENIHVGGGASRQDYIAQREARDATLSLPALILPSIQVNIQAGRLPTAEDNGIHYLKIPLDAL